MSRLLRLTIALTMLCVTAILAIKAFGSSQLNPVSEWFTNVNGSPCALPCLFGIQPGITSYEDALNIIATHPATHSMQPDSRNNALTASFGNEHLCVTFWRNDTDRVDGIILSTEDCYSVPRTDPQELELGQLMTILGVPESVELGENGISPDYYFFLDGSLYFQAWNTSHSCTVSPSMNYELLALGISDSRDLPLPEWRGFAKRTKYAQSPDDLTYLSNCDH